MPSSASQPHRGATIPTALAVAFRTPLRVCRLTRAVRASTSIGAPLVAEFCVSHSRRRRRKHIGKHSCHGHFSWSRVLAQICRAPKVGRIAVATGRAAVHQGTRRGACWNGGVVAGRPARLCNQGKKCVTEVRKLVVGSRGDDTRRCEKGSAEKTFPPKQNAGLFQNFPKRKNFQQPRG